MILDLIIEKTNDGFNADVPSLQDCDTWAHDEETAISNILERVTFFFILILNYLSLIKHV
jgi:predicted RNase H-like HicB family nuclease